MLTLRPASTLPAVLLATVMASGTALAQRAPANVHEASRPAGTNYDKADFRLWLPEGSGVVRAVVVLVPGSNGDGRAIVDDAAWLPAARLASAWQAVVAGQPFDP